MHTKKDEHQKALTGKTSRFHRIPWAPVGFLLLFFLYAWLRIESSLRYHDSAPVFLLEARFFWRFLSYPGGGVEYVAAFLAQCGYDSRVGALVSTVVAGLVLFSTRNLLLRTSGVAGWALSLGALFLLLLLHNSYGFPILVVCVGLLLGVSLAWGYAALPCLSPGLRLAGCWLGAVVLSYLAGFWPSLLFSAVCGCYELASQRRRWLGLGCLCSALVVPFWKVILPEASGAVLWAPPGQGWADLVLVGLHLFFPVAIVLLACFAEQAAPAATHPQITRPTLAAWQVSARHRFARFRRPGPVVSAGLFALGWVLVWMSFDTHQKSLLQVNCYTEQRQWDRALEAGSSVEQITSPSEINLVRALYHAGRLSEDLFAFPMPGGFELLPGLSAGLETYRSQAETLLELGQLNVAEHFAHEALECEGERPAVLKLLARINVLKGRLEAARVFLNALRKVPFHRGWAETALRSLNSDPAWPEDRDLAGIRACQVTTDTPGGAVSTEELLLQALHRNPANRMAFEYLMVDWLLRLELENVAAAMKHLGGFGYRRIPRHFEEAILLHQRVSGGPPVDLHGQVVRPETRQRFARFVECVRRSDLKTSEGRQALQREFGDSYWLYHMSRQTGFSSTPATPKTP